MDVDEWKVSEKWEKKLAMLSQCPLSMKVKDELKCTNLLLLPVICCSQARNITERRGPGVAKLSHLCQLTDYKILINSHLLSATNMHTAHTNVLITDEKTSLY